MSSTRYSQPMQIYQDPATSFDHAPMPSSRNASNSKKISPLRPIKNAASRRNIILNPPRATGPSNQSPLKSAQQTSSSPSRAPFGSKLNMIPMPPPGGPTHSTDSMEKKQPLMSKFKTGTNAAPQKALFPALSSASEKENYPQSYHPNSSAAYSEGLSGIDFSLEGLYGQKPQQKRLMDAAPIHESRPPKKVKTEPFQEGVDFADGNELPAPESFPPLRDDKMKPPHSYAQLIGMSILRAPNRRLTLAQIYKWISDTYSFYGASDAGWQNSIRHNLSLNKAFIKQERPKDDKGKGNYWAIQPGMEHQFIKEKTRKATGPIDNGPILSAHPTPAPEALQSRMFKSSVATTQDFPPKIKTMYTQPEPQKHTAPELSSDATIPASDAFQEAEGEEESHEHVPASPLIQSSPPAATMHSSPPIARHAPKRHHTPPPVPLFPSSSRSRSHKQRKSASMDDSGYFSSLDSSAVRPHRLLTSEADRPIIKRGRAEEEIARLRGSSYDSPTKNRACLALPSSSPLRKSVQKKPSQMLPPLTPAVKLTAPTRPPPSVSPNTNLRMHRDKVREMVGSPLRGVTCLDENLPWSPAFNLDDPSDMFQDLAGHTDLDIFHGTSTNFLSVPNTRSPEKKSAKRPRLDRSRGLGNVLADIPLFNHGFSKNITSTPTLKLTPSTHLSVFDDPTGDSFDALETAAMESPSKLLNLSSPTKFASPNFSLEAFDIPQDDFFENEFLVDDLDEFSGVDIMQGFQKIGASASQPSRNTPKIDNSRPSFGRNFTSRF